MLPYATAAEAEAALGRAMAWAESAWFRYSVSLPDYCLYYHVVPILPLVYVLAPLPLAMYEHGAPAASLKHKLQPRVRLSPAVIFRCFMDTVRRLVPIVGPIQLVSYPAVKMLGIRTGLPLPSAGEAAAQLLVYFLVEDYLSYWIHWLLHTRWAYDKIHHVHHKFTAPMGYAAPYMHWGEALILGAPTVVGPAIVPCHITTFWLWFVSLAIVVIDTHSGFNFPLSPAKLIPFYGGAELHDYHHFVGGQSQSNFSTVFTFCDYLYGTHKSYRYSRGGQANVGTTHRPSSSLDRHIF
ncbi:hypothetical protein ACQ4PT_061306 [Festuca glaucescens]